MKPPMVLVRESWGCVSDMNKLRDGDMLPCHGGPLDGQHRRVSAVLPFPPFDGVVSSMFHLIGNDWYCLNKPERRWEWAIETSPGVIERQEI
jgi:hypothetical protein